MVPDASASWTQKMRKRDQSSRWNFKFWAGGEHSAQFRSPLPPPRSTLSSHSLLIGGFVRYSALGGAAFLAPAHDTNARARRRETSIAMPLLLTAGFQVRLNASTARTSAGAKMRLLDSVFARCKVLLSLLYFLHFAAPPVSPIRNALRTRPRPFLRFRHRVEQTCGRRPDVCTIGRPQTAHARFRVRAGARSEQLSSSLTTVNPLMSKFPLPAFAVTRARRFSVGGGRLNWLLMKLRVIPTTI